MYSALNQLDAKLGALYKGAPKLPAKYQKGLVKYMPWVSLVVGLVSLWTAYGIWQWVHFADSLTSSINSLAAIYGAAPTVSNQWSLMLWIGVIALLAQAVVYILAFPALRAMKKSGWDLLFYGALINILYGLAVMFTSYGSLGSLIWSLIGSAIGFYFLYQIRGHYAEGKTAKAAAKK